MRQHRYLVRNILLGRLLEILLVSSVVSILVIRFYLAATGYPQIGGGGFHIAHLLWGGLLMLVAVILLLSFLGRRIQYIAALLGGIGFGAFIDELGKFITSDNNYFFQPTIALIYIIFILLLLVLRALERRPYSSREERVTNALALLQEEFIHTVREGHKDEILFLLHAKDMRDPIVQELAAAVERMPVQPSQEPGILERSASAIHGLYLRLVRSPRFAAIVITVFVVYALLFTLFLLFGVVNITALAASGTTKSFDQTLLLASSALSDILVVIGAVSLLGSPLDAYYWFKRAILVSIFLTQVFMFYTQQLDALGELAINLILLVTLNYMIRRKQRETYHESLKPSVTKA
ncbi:MAG TPA: hypothetical protein VFB12_20870 [Ktedonobacteraceae bacterium]|nr:hypothetical protein [Ktedonobacteraceae bacterium]